MKILRQLGETHCKNRSLRQKIVQNVGKVVDFKRIKENIAWQEYLGATPLGRDGRGTFRIQCNNMMNWCFE